MRPLALVVLAVLAACRRDTRATNDAESATRDASAAEADAAAPTPPPRGETTTLEGSTGQVAGAPGRLAAAWTGTRGAIGVCRDETIDDKHEGTSTRTTCRLVDVGADGALASPRWTIPDEAWLASAVHDWDTKRKAHGSLAELLAREVDANHVITPVRRGGSLGLASATELVSGGAVGGCREGRARVDDVELFSPCHLWHPRLLTATFRGRGLVLATGIDRDAFSSRYADWDGKPPSPWSLVGARVATYDGSGRWVTASVAPVDDEVVGLAMHDRSWAVLTATGAPQAGGGRLHLSIRAWPPNASASPRVLVAEGKAVQGSIAYAPTGTVTLVSSDDRGRLAGATLGATEALARLPPLGEGRDPALTSVEGRMALAFVARDAVRIACGGAGLAELVTKAIAASEPSKDVRAPVVTLAPDGASGLLAWHEGTTVRARLFRCGR